MAARKKDGGPDPKYFEWGDTLAKYEVLREWLAKNYKKYLQNESVTNKTLATLTMNLLQFQEDTFGKGSNNPPLPKLPIKLFYNYTPGGSLCHILATAYKWKVEQGWRRFDFQSPSRVDRNVEMFINIQKILLQNKLLTFPLVYIVDSVDQKLREKLIAIVKKYQGSIVDQINVATHVVYPPPPPIPDEDWLRPLHKRNNLVLVHWWYFPDSYDTWVPENDIEEEPEPQPLHVGQWEVNSRWLTDLDIFHEWMNEEDYEIQDGESEIQHSPELEANTKRKSEMRRGRGRRRGARNVPMEVTETPSLTMTVRKRKKSPSPENAKKKKKISVITEDLTKDMENPPPVPNVKEVAIPPEASRESDFTPSRSGQLTDIGSVGSDNALNTSNIESTDIKAKPATNVTTSTTVVRSSSKQGEIWLDGALEPVQPGEDLRIEAVEQAHVIVIPSYSAWFDYNSVHAIEKRALPEFFTGRNKSKSPEIYSAYRNFMVDTYRLNPGEYLTCTACRRNLAGDVCAILRVHGFLEQWGLINYQVDRELKPSPMGPPSTSHFHVLADTPSGLQPVLPPKPATKAVDQMITFNNNTTKSEGPDKSDSLTNYGLKTDIYAASAQKSKALSHLSRDWTDQETLLLLEGLEMYKDDWNKVANHVGSRTHDECILHFLRLPIEDPYLDESDLQLGPLINQPIPFSRSGNPIMSTVAFLAAIVDPRVASAAAKAAIEEFSKMKEDGDNVTTVGNGAMDISNEPSVEKLSNSTSELSDSAQTVKASDKSSGNVSTSLDSDGKNKDVPATANNRPTVEGNVSTAAAAAMAAAGVKAKSIVAMEERRIKSLVISLVETQMKKLEIKLKHFEELEAIMDREREQLEFQRQQLLRERQKFQLEQLKSAEKTHDTSTTVDQTSRQNSTRSDQAAPSQHSKVTYKQDSRLPPPNNSEYDLAQDQARTASLRQTIVSSDKYSLLNTVNTAQLSALPASISPQVPITRQGVVAAQMQQQAMNMRSLPQTKTTLSASHITQQKIAPSTLAFTAASHSITEPNVASISSHNKQNTGTTLARPLNTTVGQNPVRAAISQQSYKNPLPSSPLNPNISSIIQPVIAETNSITLSYGMSGKSSDSLSKETAAASITSSTNQILPSILRGEKIVKPSTTKASNTVTSDTFTSKSAPVAVKPFETIRKENNEENQANLQDSDAKDLPQISTDEDTQPTICSLSEKGFDHEEKQPASLETEAILGVDSEADNSKEIENEEPLKSDEVKDVDMTEEAIEAMDVDSDTAKKDTLADNENVDEVIKSCDNDDSESALVPQDSDLASKIETELGEVIGNSDEEM
ncbi:SWI/SNF complex subunit SMARCC2 [Trichoplax sp. H2]|nr:SWI/SNF complex subunit SMARCC2 [Trichoplax sp. H2]|eukprot:RDD37880.1 SWI/SNF complex subunit SMARCC2 [Trichoplax sp. H2]